MKLVSLSTHTVIVGRAVTAAMVAILDAEAPEPRSVEREPFRPDPSEWRETFDMLCMHCASLSACPVLDAMIEMKNAAPWPEGGWATDPDAGVTCLSYIPKACAKVPRQQLRALDRTPEAKLPPVCGGCAARKGSEASTSLHTRRDFQASVANQTLFNCHEDPAKARACGGWCRAVRKRRAAK